MNHKEFELFLEGGLNRHFPDEKSDSRIQALKWLSEIALVYRNRSKNQHIPLDMVFDNPEIKPIETLKRFDRFRNISKAHKDMIDEIIVNNKEKWNFNIILHEAIDQYVDDSLSFMIK